MSSTTANTESSRVFDEFSPKRMALLTRRAARYVLSKWIVICSIGLLFGLAAAAYSFFQKPRFIAEATFAIDEQVTQSKGSGLEILNRELGLGLQSDAGGVFSSITNIVELMLSRLLIEKTLRSSVEVEGKSLVFADFFLDSLGYRDKWMKDSPYYRIGFLSKKKDRKAYLFENNIMRNIYEVLVSKNLAVDNKGKGTTIILVTCASQNELFSKYFLEALLNEVTHYYIETRTERSRINLSVIQQRTDSVRLAYHNALYGRASFADAHRNAVRQTVSVKGERQQTDVEVLKSSYIQLVQSLESAKTSLMIDTPLIQYLDKPILPLKIIKPGLLQRFLIFFVLGAALAACYFVFSKTYHSLLSSN